MAVKTITAKAVLDGARRARPFNILKLADPNEYDRVPYEEFKSAVIGHPKQKEIETLLDQVVLMRLNNEDKFIKIYVYFILSLSEILREF